MRLVLDRLYTFGNATIGALTVPGLSHPLMTLEDLWRDNLPRVSCIPAGTYSCGPHGWKGEPVKYKQVWVVKKVPGRSAILIHAGNSDADTSGCILVGMRARYGRLLHSKVAIDLVRQVIGQQEFVLQINDIVKS